MVSRLWISLRIHPGEGITGSSDILVAAHSLALRDEEPSRYQDGRLPEDGGNRDTAPGRRGGA